MPKLFVYCSLIWPCRKLAFMPQKEICTFCLNHQKNLYDEINIDKRFGLHGQWCHVQRRLNDNFDKKTVSRNNTGFPYERETANWQSKIALCDDRDKCISSDPFEILSFSISLGFTYLVRNDPSFSWPKSKTCWNEKTETMNHYMWATFLINTFTTE